MDGECKWWHETHSDMAEANWQTQPLQGMDQEWVGMLSCSPSLASATSVSLKESPMDLKVSNSFVLLAVFLTERNFSTSVFLKEKSSLTSVFLSVHVHASMLHYHWPQSYCVQLRRHGPAIYQWLRWLFSLHLNIDCTQINRWLLPLERNNSVNLALISWWKIFAIIVFTWKINLLLLKCRV